MKIAFIYDAVYPFVKGGVEKRIHELAVRLAARGHDVHVAGMKFWDGPDTLCTDGYTLHGICPARPLYAGGRRTISEAMYFSSRLVPFLLREKFDLIDCQQFPYLHCIPVKIACMAKKTRFVITWHEAWGDYWYEYLGWAGFFGRGIERMVLHLTPDIVAVSGTTAEQLKALGVRGTIGVIPNGVDVRYLATIDPDPEKADLIFAGRLIREKHVDLLVRAVALLQTELPDLSLRIQGNGPEEVAIRALIQSRSLGDRIVLTPFSDSPETVISHLKAAHVCVLPSTREGFGMVALEALACGLPVITVDHPRNAIRELITEGTGFLCGLSEQELAAAIRAALARYPEMRTACIASADQFDWDRIVDRLEDCYTSRVPG